MTANIEMIDIKNRNICPNLYFCLNSYSDPKLFIVSVIYYQFQKQIIHVLLHKCSQMQSRKATEKRIFQVKDFDERRILC